MAVDLSVMSQADVIISITSTFATSLVPEHASPYKQKVEAALPQHARIFAEEVVQSISIREAQLAVAQGLRPPDYIAELRGVINGIDPQWSLTTEVTLFEGTLVGLQDL